VNAGCIYGPVDDVGIRLTGSTKFLWRLFYGAYINYSVLGRIINLASKTIVMMYFDLAANAA
jgi:hypothetical protein